MPQGMGVQVPPRAIQPPSPKLRRAMAVRDQRSEFSAGHSLLVLALLLFLLLLLFVLFSYCCPP